MDDDNVFLERVYICTLETPRAILYINLNFPARMQFMSRVINSCHKQYKYLRHGVTFLCGVLFYTNTRPTACAPPKSLIRHTGDVPAAGHTHTAGEDEPHPGPHAT